MGLRDFSRTVAEIEWLLVILVLLYHVVQTRSEDNTVALYSGLIAFSAIIIGFHYFNFVRKPGRWSLAIEIWTMIVFITYVLYHTGRVDGQLLNLYLLPIITSALTLGQNVTLLQVGLIGACYVLLGHAIKPDFLSSLTAGDFAMDIAPMLLVAYITTMLSQDILRKMAWIQIISETDELTQTYNSRALNSIARGELLIAQRDNQSLSVLMVDSDSLKVVNDTHGHEIGDEHIRQVVRCIGDEVDRKAVLSRYGGDEFLCLLPNINCIEAQAIAERIRLKVEATSLRVNTAEIHTTVSIGVATYPDHGQTFEILKRNADRALYTSKAQGKNRVTVFEIGFHG